MTVAPAKPCPFCGSTATTKVSDFATSLMVASYRCGHCNSYFEAIKWGDRTAALDVPAFLDDPRPPTD
ncbi:MAG TPA: hypothetical protein VD707_07095 [Gemmatimonadales bacterium]|nr:hypothetical protein [Gemmatimonadales bacterium]